MTTQRERFETWASSMMDHALPLGKVHFNKDARYVCDETDSAWIAWQEAERQAIERCATLCDEKAAYAKLHGGAQNGAFMAQMLADDIRTIGDEDEKPTDHRFDDTV